MRFSWGSALSVGGCARVNKASRLASATLGQVTRGYAWGADPKERGDWSGFSTWSHCHAPLVHQGSWRREWKTDVTGELHDVWQTVLLPRLQSLRVCQSGPCTSCWRGLLQRARPTRWQHQFPHSLFSEQPGMIETPIHCEPSHSASTDLQQPWTWHSIMTPKQ